MHPIRPATLADVPALATLIATSFRALSVGYYAAPVIESGLRHVVGVDTRLVADGTYHVVEADGTIVAAGGWSARRALYGGDAVAADDGDLLDPATEAARLRAFFVHPTWARRGLARRLFERCAADARAAGFRELVLGATLPGVPLYTALGFTAHERIVHPMPDGTLFEGVRMTRRLDP